MPNRKTQSSRSKRSSSGASPAKPSAAPGSQRKRWLFRLAAMVLAPLLVLLFLEAGLRLAGFGHPMVFFLPMRIEGKDCFVENDRFGWRFFGPDMARAPFPLAMPVAKPPGTIRVFVFGESAAYGDPQPEFGLSRVLEALLEGRFPDKHFEVVNTGMTAINSHVIREIAKDCEKKDGDFWVIYMGNNEVVGPYGSGTVFGEQAPSLAMVRVGLALKATRLGQAMGDFVRRAQKRPVNESEWGGMSMFVHNHVRQDDPRMATVYANFERNLDDIIDSGLEAGAKVVVSTIARNLKDCGPFASDHRTGLSSQDLARWDDLYQKGIQAQQAGRQTDALNLFQKADTIDDSFAEEHFRRGQSLLAVGQDAEATRQFVSACDLDTLRFRADTRVNEIIQRVASKGARLGVALVDSEAAVSAQSPHGLPGEEFLYEHVHLNFEGNYLIARGLAEQIATNLPGGANRPWPTKDECALRLGWNGSTRRAAEMDILSRLNDPPFKQQANNREQYGRLLSQIEHLQNANLPEALRAEKLRTQAVADAHPGDWILQENLASLQRQTGDAAGEAKSLQSVTRLLPQNSDAWESLGLALELAERDDEAVAAFQESAHLRPESVVAINSLAELYAREGHTEEAAREFQKVLRQKPYWGPAHLGLGKALEAQGKTQEAKEQFQEALKNRINTPESYNALGRFAFAKGWYDAAATNFTDSLRLYPSDPEIQVNLGLVLVQLGRRGEAKPHFEEAVRLQPNLAEAHFCLGLELGKNGDSAGAASQFAETVRLKPDLLEAHLNLGIALSNEHLNQQALDQFDEVLRHDATNQIALSYAKALRANASTVPQH